MSTVYLTSTPHSLADSTPAFGRRQASTMLVAPPQRLGWWQRLRTRRQLARLNAEQLVDIGVTRREALTEAGKLPWR